MILERTKQASYASPSARALASLAFLRRSTTNHQTCIWILTDHTAVSSSFDEFQAQSYRMADWQELTDPGSGKTYYYSPSTGVTQ